MELEIYYDTQEHQETQDSHHGFMMHARNAAKAVLLVLSLTTVWYAVMLLTGWYDPVFHMFAVFSSAIMTRIAPSSGLISKLAD